MCVTIRQISSLDKIFKENPRKASEIERAEVLKGERFSYQLAIYSRKAMLASVEVESELPEAVRLYREGFANCDMPSFAEGKKDCVDENYLTFRPCLIPDILQPVSEGGKLVRLREESCLLWVRVDVPRETESGEYEIRIRLKDEEGNSYSKTMVLTVLPLELPESGLIYTQWMYCDCIAAWHETDVFSEDYWKLVEAYIQTAADCGTNMLLTPVHNPPLDTAVGKERPDVQLVSIEKTEGHYRFDFSLLERWVSICRKNGISRFEIPHLCTQWGAKAAPNIYVWENGERKHMFGWHTASDSEEYVGFLREYLPVLTAKLKELGVFEHTCFHISDEPFWEHQETYGKMARLFHSLVSEGKVIDALSHVDFYKNGLVPVPVAASNHIEPFLEEDIEERWVYYCCEQGKDTSNRFLAMSAHRNRIMGIQMYKFQIAGFLHWGFNSYFAQHGRYLVNPYLTTSADGTFPSGDAFSVYPTPRGVLPSMRAFVFYEALQDVALCRLLEQKTDHAHVAGLIDEVAGKDVRFASMPEDETYLFRLRERILDELKCFLQGGSDQRTGQKGGAV